MVSVDVKPIFSRTKILVGDTKRRPKLASKHTKYGGISVCTLRMAARSTNIYATEASFFFGVGGWGVFDFDLAWVRTCSITL